MLASRQCCRNCGRVEDAVFVDILTRIVTNHCAVNPASGNHGNLAREVYETFQHCWRPFQGGKGFFGLGDVCYADLTFAIIPETAGFEDGRRADGFQRGGQIRQAIDLRVGGDGDAEVCKEGFFGDAILGNSQRFACGADWAEGFYYV